MIILEYDIMMIMLYNNDVNLLPLGVARGMAGSTSTLLREAFKNYLADFAR